MPWKCPACQTDIPHTGDLPQPKQVYRCHVCRLELVLDNATQRLADMLRDEAHAEAEPRIARRLREIAADFEVGQTS